MRANLVLQTFMFCLVATHVSAIEMAARLRRPVAIASSDDGNWIYVANRDSGTVSMVDCGSLAVIDELQVGKRLSDIASRQDTLLVVDAGNDELVRLRKENNRWTVASRTPVATGAARIILDPNSQRCVVASGWSRTVTVMEIPGGEGNPQQVREIELPFEPREMCFAQQGKYLVVASTFDAQLAVVDTDKLKLISVKQIPGHNIRGLALSGDQKRLCVTQQDLNPIAHSTRDDVHWGNMIANILVTLPIAIVADPSSDVSRYREVNLLGEPGLAAGDPGTIVVGPDEEMAILFSGVGEVSLYRDGGLIQRVSVGERPFCAVRNGRNLFVANMFSDSISVVDVQNAKAIRTISLGPRLELTQSQRGEALFYNAKLSHDGWMSCHSCHTDGHSNGQLNDNLSDGSFGAPKRVPSLLGVGETKPWGWNGKVESLEHQVVNSIEKTMRGSSPTEQQVASIVAFMRTLHPRRDVLRVELRDSDAVLQRGEELFRVLDCVRCHVPPTYTSPKAYNVGLKDNVGNEKFNPPSLRGVGARRRLFHDGRASSITEVVSKYKHQLDEELPAADINALVTYLKTR